MLLNAFTPLCLPASCSPPTPSARGRTVKGQAYKIHCARLPHPPVRSWKILARHAKKSYGYVYLRVHGIVPPQEVVHPSEHVYRATQLKPFPLQRPAKEHRHPVSLGHQHLLRTEEEHREHDTIGTVCHKATAKRRRMQQLYSRVGLPPKRHLRGARGRVYKNFSTPTLSTICLSLPLPAYERAPLVKRGKHEEPSLQPILRAQHTRPLTRCRRKAKQASFPTPHDKDKKNSFWCAAEP